MSAPMRVGLGEGQCYCQPDIGWTCHHHENAPIPDNPHEDERAVKTVLALRHREGRRHSCTCCECRAIVRVGVLARERIAIGGKRHAKKRHHAALAVAATEADALAFRLRQAADSGDCGHALDDLAALGESLRDRVRSVYGNGGPA